MQSDWTSLKSVLVNRGLSAQSVVVGSNYWIKAVDGVFELECILPIDTSNEESLDFVTNFLPVANKKNSTPIQGSVTTLFETNDKDLKVASGCAAVDTETGIATVIIPVPGIMANGDGRWVAGGTAFFDVADAGDKVLDVVITDIDNVLGYGAGAPIKSYGDEDQASSDNLGWYIPPKKGISEVEPIGGYAFIPAQLYVVVTGRKIANNRNGTMYVNMFWGKKG